MSRCLGCHYYTCSPTKKLTPYNKHLYFFAIEIVETLVFNQWSRFFFKSGRERSGLSDSSALSRAKRQAMGIAQSITINILIQI